MPWTELVFCKYIDVHMSNQFIFRWMVFFSFSFWWLFYGHLLCNSISVAAVAVVLTFLLRMHTRENKPPTKCNKKEIGYNFVEEVLPSSPQYLPCDFMCKNKNAQKLGMVKQVIFPISNTKSYQPRKRILFFMISKIALLRNNIYATSNFLVQV